MGQNESKPKIDHTETRVIVESKGYTSLPVKIPKSNSVQMINASGNKILKLPCNLSHVIDLNLNGNGYSTVPPAVIKAICSYSNLESLNLSMNSLDTIPIEITSLKSVKRIELAQNKITKIDLSKSSAESVDISQNRLTEFPEIPNTLTNIDADYNIIETANIESTNLVRVTINMNRLSMFDIKSAIQTLWRLELSKNSLDSLPDLAKYAPNLKHLDVSTNLLTELPSLPNSITNITACDNQIKEIPESIISLTHLTSLDLSNNYILHVPTLPSSLTSVMLYDNQIESMDDQDLPQATSFIILRNQLKSINRFNIKSKDYHFHANQIAVIPEDAIQKDAKCLFFNSNIITEIPEFFSRLTASPHILLANNKIRSICPSFKNSCTQILDLSLNPIGDIPDVLPSTLLRLMVGYCGLTKLPPIEHLDQLLVLSAPGNQIKELPYIKSLVRIDLSRNSLEKFPVLPQSVEQIDFSCNQIKEVPDLDLPNLVEFDISHNGSEILGKLVTPKLQILKLSHNPALKGTIDLSNYHSIESVDVAVTEVSVKNVPEGIREIIQSSGERTMQTKIISECEWAGYAEIRGFRPTMEDSIIVAPNFGHCDAFAVLDGHGGHKTANAAAFLLADRLERAQRVDRSSLDGVIDFTVGSLRSKGFEDGSTMALMVLVGNTFISAHLGDARTMLIDREGNVTFITVDHKPTSREEVARINGIGGIVANKRTGGILAVSRSLGDFPVNGISHLPTVTTRDLEENERWAVIACDGVFDVCTPEMIGQMTLTAKSAAELAYDVRNAAIQLMSTDNVSVIAIDLDGRRAARSEAK